MRAPTASSRGRAWAALLLGLVSVATLPVGIEVSRHSKLIVLLDVAYAIPVAFVLGLVAAIMARRARKNLRWLRLRDGGMRVASAAVVVSTLAVCMALTAALSVGFYELVLLYQHSR